MFLDTTFCIDLMREEHRGIGGPAVTKLRALGGVSLYAAVFVICELQAGARLSRHPIQELRKVEWFADQLEIVYPDSSFAVAYGELESYLRKKGKTIPLMDLLIGVSARMRGLPLLTRDTNHFEMIPGLVVETY